MPKVKAKLSRGEIVLPPQVVSNPQIRARLEEMNKEGLLARNMGGVAAYRNGGAVYRQTGGTIDPFIQQQNTARLAHDAQEEQRARRSRYGAGLVHIGSNDFIGASDALAYNERPFVESNDPSIKEDEKSNAEKNAIVSLMNKAAKAYSLVDPASPALKYVRDRSEITTVQWAAIFAGIRAGGDPKDAIEALTGQADIKLSKATEKDEGLAAAEVAYTELKAYLTEMTTVALAAQGSGPKTDFDFIVAERSVANLSSTDASIKNSMKRVIDSGMATAEIEGWTDVKRPQLVEGEKGDRIIPGLGTGGGQYNNPHDQGSLIDTSDNPFSYSPDEGATVDPTLVAPHEEPNYGSPKDQPTGPLPGVDEEPEDDGNTGDEVDFSFDFSGKSIDFSVVPLKDVPDSVWEFWKENGKPKNKPVLGNDGYVYIRYDKKRTDLTLAKWGRSIKFWEAY